MLILPGRRDEAVLACWPQTSQWGNDKVPEFNRYIFMCSHILIYIYIYPWGNVLSYRASIIINTICVLIVIIISDFLLFTAFVDRKLWILGDNHSNCFFFMERDTLTWGLFQLVQWYLSKFTLWIFVFFIYENHTFLIRNWLFL